MHRQTRKLFISVLLLSAFYVGYAACSGVHLTANDVYAANDPNNPYAGDAGVLNDAGNNGTLDANGNLILPTTGSGYSIGADGKVYCGTVLCQCNDGVDNDNDGKIDLFDTLCSGAQDNDESSISLGVGDNPNSLTGINGDNVTVAHQDCFFDGDTGPGNDRCEYDTQCLCPEPWSDSNNDGKVDDCLKGTTAIPYSSTPDCNLEQKEPPKPESKSCKLLCGQYIPNGCDGKGCCDFYKANGDKVEISLALSSKTCDPNVSMAGCVTCTQDTDVVNTCDTCEICLGKSPSQPNWPAQCQTTQTQGGNYTGYTCTNPAYPATKPCYDANGTYQCLTTYEYCQTGCCAPAAVAF